MNCSRVEKDKEKERERENGDEDKKERGWEVEDEKEWVRVKREC